ncbi:MAG: FAD-dependent oxidoreductase [Sulfurimonas sp.]|uniref:phytoene desaturase family protein n=1 Tax=Sulfurimonas sp. TaxID=2022749 RepID=UPI0025F327AA|nr:FAD-dependent oxidoreductase [Sulfurimonas sp.]MCK9492002.1 FAD-dependent oxidoreductase [Sulfurimonas sp.]
MKIAIIGGGLSGLLCALMLERRGYSPTIYERLSKLGGVLDSFKRKKVLFDIGFHYSGALEKGQYLYNSMQGLELLEKLKLEKYDGAFDTLYIDDEIFEVPLSSLEFKKQLQARFPKESENIEIFFHKCYEVSEISSKPEQFVKVDSRSLKDVMKDIKDEKLRKVFLHFTIFYATAFYEDASFDFYAKIFINMLDGTRKIEGGGGAIISALKESLSKTTIKKRSEVTKIFQDKNGVNALLCKDEKVAYDAIISTVHPKTTLKMFDDLDKKQRRYQSHIEDLEESPSFFSIFCLIDAQIESNLYFYGDEFISVLPSRIYKGKTVATILAGSYYSEYENLSEDEYKKKKEQECQHHLNRVRKLYDFGEIEVIDSSTPLTKQHYSNGSEGSIYGVLCSAKQKSLSVVMPRTRVKNLYFAGENIIAPGLIGAFLGAEILMNYFEEKK